MFSTHNDQWHDARRAGRRSMPSTAGQEPEKKPKKINSEIRKQQNRIASRNYREKRKRKLQYLQQLIRGGDSTEPAETVQYPQSQRMISPEYYPPGPVASNMTLVSNDPSSASTPTNGNFVEPTSAAASSYRNQSHATSHTYPRFESTWNTHALYHVPLPISVSAWNVPTWMPNIEFSPPMTTRSADDFQFTPPPPPQDSFDQLPTPPRLAHTPDPDLFSIGSHAHCKRRYVQSIGISSVSLPSSPFGGTRYPGPSCFKH